LNAEKLAPLASKIKPADLAVSNLYHVIITHVMLHVPEVTRS